MIAAGGTNAKTLLTDEQGNERTYDGYQDYNIDHQFPIMHFYNPDVLYADQYFISSESPAPGGVLTQKYGNPYLDVAVMQDKNGVY